MPGPERRGLEARRDLVLPAAVLLFLAYAVNFLYFFVDDEGTAFVYAQHLLRGQGLTYSVSEGATEGYSNFLQVWLGAGILGVAQIVGLPKVGVFFAGKALSLLAGAALVGIVARALRQGLSLAARGPAVVFLALSGPVAAWSCTSLETIPFALAFTGFMLVLLGGPSRPVLAVFLATLTILARVDGFAYVGAAWSAAFVFGPDIDRRDLVTRVAVPVALVFSAYTAWRFWYFGSILSLPLQAKVLYKLLPSEALVSNDPATSYLTRFLQLYHPLGLALLALGWLPFWRGEDRRPLVVLATALVLGVYVSIVGDWMFGFRLFTAVMPLLALLTAFTLQAVSRRAPTLALACGVAVVVWSGVQARVFVHQFERADALAGWRSWWTSPSLDTARYFAPYYDLYADVRDRIEPESVTVNNQAGFLPFMLDLENIDDLGICSRFFAGLPTSDIVFTEVGRYHPLTPRPPLRAGMAYLVHRKPSYLISWKHLLRSANRGRVPEELLGGRFRLAMESAHQVVYEPTGVPTGPLGLESFRENLVHPAQVGAVAVQGAVVPRDDLLDVLPFLATSDADYAVDGALEFEFHLPDDPVYSIWIDQMRSTADMEVELILRGGDRTFRDRVVLVADQPSAYHHELDHATTGGIFLLRATTAAGEGARLSLTDLRVLGQSDALRRFIRRELFPAD